MQGVFQRKPMSQILANPAGQKSGEQTEDKAEKPEAASHEDVPEKYRGKSLTEIIDMHRNSEKRLGQIQNEVGQLRGLVSELAQIQRAPVAPTTEVPKSVDVSGDDLIRRPADAIRKVVQPMLDQVVKKEADTKATSTADDALLTIEQNALLADFGDPREIAGSDEFQEFVSRTASRQADFQRACDSSAGIEQIRAARRLLEDFQDFKSSVPSASPQTKSKPEVESARRVANEGAGPSGRITTKDPIYEADVIALIRSNPEKYRSPSFQAQLHAAIREGRFIKNG